MFRSGMMGRLIDVIHLAVWVITWIMVQYPAEPNAVSMKVEAAVHLICWNKPLVLCGVKTRKTEGRKKEGGRWGVISERQN
jgi:hypothetical protein